MSPDVLGIPADAFDEPDATDGAAPQPSAATTSTRSPAPAAAVAANAPAASETGPAAQELEYQATLSGVPVTSATAEFKVKTKDSVPAYKFKTKVAGGPPGASYDIKVDRVSIGSVTLDDTGTCALELSTKLANFPANFPLQAGPGSIVELGSDLKGTLALVTPKGP